MKGDFVSLMDVCDMVGSQGLLRKVQSPATMDTGVTHIPVIFYSAAQIRLDRHSSWGGDV